MSLPKALMRCQSRPGAQERDIIKLEMELLRTLPDDYKHFLRMSDGLEGFLAPSVYLVLWPVQEINSLNNGYCVHEFLPGAILLGTDGGDTGYGLSDDSPNAHYFSIPLVGMTPTEMHYLGDSFEDFLERLRESG